MHHRGAFYRGKNIPLRPDAWYLLDNVVLLACSILAINFFLLPSSSRFLPISFTSLSPSLSFSLSQIALRCVGGRQSGQFTLQWLVHLSLSPSVSLSPSLYPHSFSSRSFFSRAPSLSLRYPRTRSVPVPRACAIPVLRACAIRFSTPTVSPSLASPLKPVQSTGTVPIENIYIATNTPFRRSIVFSLFLADN